MDQTLCAGGRCLDAWDAASLFCLDGFTPDTIEKQDFRRAGVSPNQRARDSGANDQAPARGESHMATNIVGMITIGTRGLPEFD